MKLMDARLFSGDPMGLRDDLLRLPLDQRFTYDPQHNLFFINFEGYVIRTHDDVERIRKTVEEKLSTIQRKVYYVIVNYDNFTILPDVLDDYTPMVKALVDQFYSGVTRYTTSGFLRTKLGDLLANRNVAPHIYESADEARQHLHELESKIAD
jgi:propionate CoA-transferase